MVTITGEDKRIKSSNLSSMHHSFNRLNGQKPKIVAIITAKKGKKVHPKGRRQMT